MSDALAPLREMFVQTLLPPPPAPARPAGNVTAASLSDRERAARKRKRQAVRQARRRNR